MPTTVADFDRELEETKKKMARLKEGRKAAAAKEREQERKWRAAVASAMGDMLLESLGCGWNEIDLAELQPRLEEWADGHRDDIRTRVVAEGRSASDAKQALDSFKRAKREARKAAARTPEPQQATSETEDAGEDIASW